MCQEDATVDLLRDQLWQSPGVEREEDELIVATDRLAADLAGVSTRVLHYWSFKGVVTPGVSRKLSIRNTVRIYDFQELISLLVVAELRKRGLGFRRIRKVVDHLRARGYVDPLRELVFAVAGDGLYFQHPDGTWEGGARPDQIVLHETLNLDVIRAIIRNGVRRPADAHGRIERRRRAVGSKPVFAGTRVPVGAVKEWLDAGHSTARVLEAYPDLSEADVDAARGFRVSA